MANLTFLQRLKLRHKLAAIGVVGLALLLLPLVQVLRWNSLELQWAQAAQDQLAPALLTVDLQRGLVAHRQTAAKVLQGQTQAEAERRNDQAAVDARLAMLGHRLQGGSFAASQRELGEMRADWMALVQRIVSGRSTVLQSNQAHRLLIEQTLQIVDNLSLSHADATPLRHAAAAARQLLLDNPDQVHEATALLGAARTRIESGHAAAMSLHQAHRTVAASAMLSLLALLVSLCGWLLLASRRMARSATGGAHARHTHAEALVQPPLGCKATTEASVDDGQRASRLLKMGLMQRLRGRPAAPQSADRPTQPHDL